jgi:anti-sigma B factor antagonist
MTSDGDEGQRLIEKVDAHAGTAALRVSGPVAVIRVAGEVDVATAPQLQEATARLGNAHGVAVVDLTDVTFIDSSGLAVLASAWKAVTEVAGGDLLMVVPRPDILQVFEITGLAEVMTFYGTLDEALARADAIGGGDREESRPVFDP